MRALRALWRMFSATDPDVESVRAFSDLRSALARVTQP